MIISLCLFEPWRVWPWDRHTETRAEGVGNKWHDWHVIVWLFFRVEIRGRRLGL